MNLLHKDPRIRLHKRAAHLLVKFFFTLQKDTLRKAMCLPQALRATPHPEQTSIPPRRGRKLPILSAARMAPRQTYLRTRT